MSFAVDQVVNEGTQWEYSLSVPIRQLINNNLFTAANIEEYVFSGLTDNRVNYIANVEDPETIDTQTKNRSYNGKYNQTTFLDWSENVPNEISYQNGSELAEFQFYQRNVLVAPATPGSTALGLDSLRLVLDIKDIKNWIMDYDTNPVHSQVTLTSDNGQSGNGYSGTAYHWGSSAAVGPTITTRQTTGAGITKGLHVATITIINGELWFGYLNPSNNHNEFYQNQGFSRRLQNIYGASSQTNQYRSGKRGMWTQSTAKYSMYPSWNSPVFPPSSDIGVSSVDKSFYNVNTNGVVIDCAYKYNDAYDGVAITSCSASSGYLAKDYNTLLTWLSWCGLYFRVDGITYKPIISGGVITGYTSDMSRPSEFDNMSNVTGNSVPSTPPAPGPGPDDESDDQASGGIYSGAQGMCNLYYMTAGEIKDLQNWFRGSVFSPGIQIPADFDPSNQLIGLMAFPIELGGSVDSTTITFRTADNQSVNTGVSCQKAYGDDLKFDMGTIDIPARMAQRGVPFLDYSCQVEVYIPFCDVVQLDVQQVIGTTLKCEMWISPSTGDVSAMLSSGTHPVAYTSGNCAQQLPISVSSYGAIAGAKLAAQNRNTQAVFQAAQNVIKDVTNTSAIGAAVSNHTAVNGQGLVEFSRIPQVQSNAGLAVGAGIKAAGTMINTALQLTAQNFDNRYALQVAKNSAPTHVSGSFGSCTSWHFPNYCYVKITRPHFQKPDNYGHTEAVPVVATKQLSSLTGLTTCVNPDVSGIGTATMQELETIKGYLMSGVIL